jgi:hypothetical protein
LNSKHTIFLFIYLLKYFVYSFSVNLFIFMFIELFINVFFIIIYLFLIVYLSFVCYCYLFMYLSCLFIYLFIHLFIFMPYLHLLICWLKGSLVRSKTPPPPRPENAPLAASIAAALGNNRREKQLREKLLRAVTIQTARVSEAEKRKRSTLEVEKRERLEAGMTEDSRSDDARESAFGQHQLNLSIPSDSQTDSSIHGRISSRSEASNLDAIAELPCPDLDSVEVPNTVFPRQRFRRLIPNNRASTAQSQSLVSLQPTGTSALRRVEGSVASMAVAFLVPDKDRPWHLKAPAPAPPVRTRPLRRQRRQLRRVRREGLSVDGASDGTKVKSAVSAAARAFVKPNAAERLFGLLTKSKRKVPMRKQRATEQAVIFRQRPPSPGLDEPLSFAPTPPPDSLEQRSSHLDMLPPETSDDGNFTVQHPLVFHQGMSAADLRMTLPTHWRVDPKHYAESIGRGFVLTTGLKDAPEPPTAAIVNSTKKQGPSAVDSSRPALAPPFSRTS